MAANPAHTQDPDDRRRYHAIIAGGGFAGGTLALALARFGPKNVRIALVDATHPEAENARSSDPRGLAISAASKNLLDAVGVWSAVEGRAQAIQSIEVTDAPLNADLRPYLLGFDDELASGEIRAHIVPAGSLLCAISASVAAEPKIDVFAPDSVITYETDAYGLDAQLQSAAILRAPLLIAADGKRSRLREHAGIKTIGWSYPQVGIVATVIHERPHGGRAVQHFLPAGPFAMLPLTENRSSIVWTEDKVRAADLMNGDSDAFLAELSRRFGHRLGSIQLEDAPQSFPLALQMARSFVGDRLALLGDAAHVVHPLAGQGLNIGYRDVAALAETIVDAMRLGLDIGAATILERYERRRRFDSAFSAIGMDGLNRLFSNDSAPLRALRDLGLGLVDRAPALKRFLAREAAGATGDVPRLLRGESL